MLAGVTTGAQAPRKRGVKAKTCRRRKASAEGDLFTPAGWTPQRWSETWGTPPHEEANPLRPELWWTEFLPGYQEARESAWRATVVCLLQSPFVREVLPVLAAALNNRSKRAAWRAGGHPAPKELLDEADALDRQRRWITGRRRLAYGLGDARAIAAELLKLAPTDRSTSSVLHELSKLARDGERLARLDLFPRIIEQVPADQFLPGVAGGPDNPDPCEAANGGERTTLMMGRRPMLWRTTMALGWVTQGYWLMDPDGIANRCAKAPAAQRHGAQAPVAETVKTWVSRLKLKGYPDEGRLVCRKDGVAPDGRLAGEWRACGAREAA